MRYMSGFSQPLRYHVKDASAFSTGGASLHRIALQGQHGFSTGSARVVPLLRPSSAPTTGTVMFFAAALTSSTGGEPA